MGEIMKALKNVLVGMVCLIFIILTVYDTHTDLIIDCEKVYAECKLIAVPTPVSLNND